MISKQEIMDLVREFSLEAKTIEKDYVLGWLLAGIGNHAELFKKWVFKGGTCLKKCYFETYRFSEDLDYTLIDEQHINEKFLVACFNEIAEWIYNLSGIEIVANQTRFEIYQNNAGKRSVEGRIYYIGPLQRRNSFSRIKLDLTTDEVLVLPSESRDVHHPYSDKPIEGIKANCYRFTEVFAEKIRALSERARPRDLYDVIHLYRHVSPSLSAHEVYEVLTKKCIFKNIPVPTIDQLLNHSKIKELQNEWENMLAHQLPQLPTLEQFWQELPQVFSWLYGTDNKALKQKIPTADKDNINNSWRPPSMLQAWHSKVPLELIRFAGANHLCIELLYENKIRLIEPYDLKKTQDGNLLLIALRHDDKEWRSYRIDRIQEIKITQIPYQPQYLISLTPFVETFSVLPFNSQNAINRNTKKAKMASLSIYTIQCNVCSKKFKRKNLSTKIHPHKDKNGRLCHGRIGFRIN